MMNRLLFFFFTTALLTILPGATQAQKPSQPAFPDAKKFSNSEITYKVIEGAGKTWGYDIFSNGKLMIHQPTVPGLPGNDGFKTKAGAEKVAQLVVGKIKNGEMPPSVTIDEMKKVKAIE